MGVLGVFSLLLFQQVFSGKTPVVMSDTGMLDHRLFKREIPWSDVEKVTVASHGAANIRIELTPRALEHIEMTVSARLGCILNKPFGVDGLYIHAMGLDASHAELADTLHLYLARYNPNALSASR